MIFFPKNRTQNNSTSGTSQGAIIWQRFLKRKRNVWSLRILGLLFFMALFGNFIANEKPIYCKVNNQHYFPVFKNYLVEANLAKWEPIFLNSTWSEIKYQKVLMPIIPYSSNTIDRKNVQFKSPLGKQDVSSWHSYHWLGTNALGQDVLAGIITGTKTALMIGICSILIAAFIGIFLGLVVGYYGDQNLYISTFSVILNLLSLPLIFFYTIVISNDVLYEAGLFGFIRTFIIVVFIITLLNFFISFIEKRGNFKKRIPFQIDLLLMRFIEIIEAIPTLIILLAIIAISKASALLVILIIGFFGWTSIARLMRAETLKIKNLSYIESSKAIGVPNLQIMFKHILPNAIGPIIVIIAFGIAGTVLFEAFLSFLGLGLPPDQITWGGMLQTARGTPSAWWIAIFPGFAIFITVSVFSMIGTGLSDAMRGKS